MVGSFDDVTIEWRGKPYTIPARNMMGAIARIEDHVTMPELGRYGDRQTVPLSRLASAFASVLRFAGCQVKDEEVYSAMFEGEDVQKAVGASMQVLMTMMVPKSARDKQEANQANGEAPASAPGKPAPAASVSSPKHTSSRSAQTRVGVRHKNFGSSRPKNFTG